MLSLVRFNYEGIGFIAPRTVVEPKIVRNVIELPNGLLIRARGWTGDRATGFTVVDDECPADKTHLAVPNVSEKINVDRRIWGTDILTALQELADLANSISRTAVYCNPKERLAGLTSAHLLDNFQVTTVTGDPIAEPLEYTKKALVIRSTIWPPINGKTNHRSGRLDAITRYCQEHCADLAHTLSELIG